MATRKIKDAQDTTTNELIYFKGHAKATYMSDGRNVEEAIHQIGTGEGGGGITVETDPIFSASPAAGITEEQIVAWDDLDEMVALLDKDVATLTGDVQEVQESLTDLDTIRSGAAKGATAVQPGDIEDVARLDEEYVVANGIVSKQDVYYHLPDITTDDTAHTLATKDDVSLAVETYIADFTIMSLRDGIYNGVNVDCNVQGLVDAMNANKVILVREDEDSSYKGVYVLNGYAEDFLYFSIVDTSGNILWCEGTDYKSLQGIDARTLYERSWDYKQDELVSGENIKTINGENILGSGDITISGGSGEQGPQGEKGDKGDKGDTGVGVQSVKQTTISNTDGGSNVVTVTLTNGATSTFTVKNGSKGSTGTNGTNGKDGADGEDGATFTPSVDSAGNLSWTNNKGLANPPTVNIKGPKGDAGEGGGSSGGGGVETITLSGGFGNPLIIEEMLAEKRYWLYVEGGIDGTEESIVIGGFEGDGVKDGAHIRRFYAVIECASPMGGTFNVSLSLPDVVIRWSTGTPIPIIGDGLYELSITQVIESGYAYYNAVLTSFSQS